MRTGQGISRDTYEHGPTPQSIAELVSGYSWLGMCRAIPLPLGLLTTKAAFSAIVSRAIVPKDRRCNILHGMRRSDRHRMYFDTLRSIDGLFAMPDIIHMNDLIEQFDRRLTLRF
jgi:hypothetical protein